MAKKIELLHTTYDESGNIESQEVVHPLTSPDCIIMENGKTLDEVMGDGIATPTLTHEGTSFKVGVGDSNIEVVDGDVAGMTIKGQSYQNILPKPTTLIMETDEQEFKINDKIDSNIIIDDNIAEIATVKGKTIVNAVQEESGSEYTVLGEDLSGQSIVTTNKLEGNIKGVTLQGQTLVNTIQEPCKDDYVVLGADGIEISAETSGHGTIEDTIGGSIKSAILKGQTLVNLARDVFPNNISQYTTLATLDITMIKPNTKYFVKIKNKTSEYKKFYINESIFDNNNNNLDVAANSQTSKLINTVDSPIGSAFIKNRAEHSSTNEIDVVLIEYQEGMENWDIPYFEGMQSVKMPVLTSTGKNLFDGKMIQGTVMGATGIPSEHGERMRSDYIPVNTNNITVSCLSGKWVGVFAYREDKSYIGYISSTGSATYKPQEKISFVIISTEEVENYSTTIQVEENSIATSYEPYKSNILTVNEEVELRGIGEVKDELDLMTGELTQRIGEVVLDGTQSYSKATLPPNTDKSIYSRFYITGISNYNSDGIIADNFTVGKYVDISERLETGSGGTIGIMLLKSRLSTDDAIGLKTYLTSNPITVQYQLATESVKTVDLTVTDQDGNTIPHIQTQPTVTHITASSDYLIPTVTIDNNLSYDTIIKPSTLYTVRFAHNTVNTDNPLTVNLGGTTQTVTSTEFTITTPSELAHNQLVFSGKNNVVSEVQVIEGDVTNIEYPFFEGMNDVQITDMIRNVNLFDMNDTVPGYLGGTGTEIKVPDHGNLTSNYIKVKPNTAYVYNHGGFVPDFVEYWTGMYFYQDDRGTESNLYTGGTHNRFVYTGQEKQYTNFKFTTPEDCEYIRIGSRGLSHDGAWATLYQLDNFSDSKFVGRGKNLLHVGKGYSTTNNYNGLTVIRNEVDQTITVDGTCTLDNTSCALAPFYREFKKGERYALSCKLISGTADKILFRVNDEQWKGNISCGLKATSSNTYETSIKTFYHNETYNRSSIRVDNGATFNNAVFKVMLEKIPTSGDYTPQYEPYKGVEVQQDVDSIPLTSDMFEQGVRTRSMGMSLQQCPLTSNTTRISSKTLIPVKPNSKYTVLGIDTSVNHIWGDMYDKDGLVCYDSVLDLTGGISSGTGVFIPHDVHYLCIKIKNADESAITPSILDSMNLILQEVPQEIVLRGIGDVKDELDLTRGEYIQRISEIVLADQKNIGFGSKTSETWFEALVYLDDYIKVASNGTTKIINNKLPLIGDTSLATTSYIRNNAGAENYIVVALTVEDMGGLTGYDGWHYYVKNNDVVIQYELATPIIHKVNLTNTKVIPSYGTETHYETITPSDSLIPSITIPSTLNYDVAIKPSTEYTIRANTSDNLTVDLGGATGTLSNGKVTLTTPATLTHNEVKFSGTGKVKELMVVEGNEIKDNVPFFNGMKDVQMGGIKLVNIARGATCSRLVTANTNKTQFTYISDGAANAYHTIYFDSSLLKTNTVYTVFADITTNTSGASHPIKFQFGYTSGNLLDVRKGFVGKIKQTITSANTTKDGLAIVFRPCSSGGKVVIQNPMIIEGDWTHLDTIPFIESEMIIEQPIIRSQGKNLFDINNLAEVTYNITNYSVLGNTISGTPTQPFEGFGTTYIKVKKGNLYTVSCKVIANTSAKVEIRQYNHNMNLKDHLLSLSTITTNSNKTVQALGDIFKITISNGDSLEYTEISDIQIEEGSTATSYEPYKHQTLYSNRVIGYEEGCYYQHNNGNRTTNANFNSIIADVEGLSVAYITHGHSNFSFWDKDGVYISGKAFMDTNRYGDSNNNGFIAVPSNAKYIKFPSGKTNEVTSNYTKATVTGDLPLRSLPNGVCDTLNLVTGEYVQRVGEVVLDGSESWIQHTASSLDKTHCFATRLPYRGSAQYSTPLCTDKISNHSVGWVNDAERIWINEFDAITLHLFKNKCNSMNEFKQYLQQNPITVQYELETPIVRKLGFTTKGNYREQVLDGREEWIWNQEGALKTTERFSLATITDRVCGVDNLWCNTIETINTYNFDAEGLIGSSASSTIYLRIKKDKCDSSWDGFIKWLSQNPTKISYLTNQQSSESYSNIHKPIFFNNVDVQFLPQNLDIQPSLTLQARTKNSYVMDMMKANTKYSIKLLDYSGNMTIDGTSYTLANNRTFISPSTLSNKELIVSGQWYEPMIIEGDVTGKNLPYFKGILSSYHDVDEIEVYSVTKNLFNIHDVQIESNKWETTIDTEKCKITSKRVIEDNTGAFATRIVINNIKPSTRYCLRWVSDNGGMIYVYTTELWDSANQLTATHGSDGKAIFYTPANTDKIVMGLNYGDTNGLSGKDYRTLSDIALYEIGVNEEITEKPTYIPHAHSTTLIEMPTRLETVKVVRPVMEEGRINLTNGELEDNYNNQIMVRNANIIPVQPNDYFYCRNGQNDRYANIACYDIDKNFICYYTQGSKIQGYLPNNCYFINFYIGKSNCSDLTITIQRNKPIQLNSLPNGVCDEIIMKPNSNKTQLIQRVGKVVLDGSEDWRCNPTAKYFAFAGVGHKSRSNGAGAFSDKLNYLPGTSILANNIDGFSLGGSEFIQLCKPIFSTTTELQTYLQENPITVYYELATPIIHEIQLKGYPHVYENGTVTLNTDVPHQSFVSYNVNQEQLINTQNETIIRHDQQIDDLYYYIELYLEEIYQMELFRMKLELSL